jgi:hypothetical protein
MPQWWSDKHVGELLMPVDGVVPVVGAGVSRNAELPDAQELATWLIANAPMTRAPPDGARLFQVADAVDPTRWPADELQRRVGAYIASFPLRRTRFLDQLVQLPSRFIVTFNYDDLIGFAAEQQGLQVCRLSALHSAGRLEAHRRLTLKYGDAPAELTILHLHGQASAPETLVLDKASYNELADYRAVKDIVFMLTHFRSLAFVGTKLDEVYLLDLLQKQLNAAFHVVFAPGMRLRG